MRDHDTIIATGLRIAERWRALAKKDQLPLETSGLPALINFTLQATQLISPSMQIAFRVDASSVIGHGHVMRCLTLAEELRRRGNVVFFISREHDGNLCGLIEERGFAVARLPASRVSENATGYAASLGEAIAVDVERSTAAIASHGSGVDWLVVDHYALDTRWESALRGSAAHVMVIDDLANRNHDCDVLLDQNLVRGMPDRYEGRLPSGCAQLLGPDYALLRPEYAELHQRVMPRTGPVQSVCVFFGGADRTNLTAQAIAALVQVGRGLRVTVVVARGNPFEASIRAQARDHPNIRVLSALPSLAPILSEVDLALGAGGATSWERLCLGVPSLVVTLADNQREIAEQLHTLGLIQWLGSQEAVDVSTWSNAIESVVRRPSVEEWSAACLRACDGRGASRVADRLQGRHP